MNPNQVSIIMATYNRAHTLPRAISSVLQQTIDNWELIIIDDGSTDNTQEILSHYIDPRITVLANINNRGVAVSRNWGLDIMKGEWFTLLDSDDEMIPDALATMLEVPNKIDSRINAITCNCIDSLSGNFTGWGLDHDQWLDYGSLVSRCYGEHWGITKSSLLSNLRFNELLPWGESVLWYRISKEAYRYYIHQGLRIYHTQGDDRLSRKVRAKNIEDKYTYYRELTSEVDYLNALKQYRSTDYATLLARIVLVQILDGNNASAKKWISEGNHYWNLSQRIVIQVSRLLGPNMLRKLVPILVNLR